jgi:hypothetical protein
MTTEQELRQKLHKISALFDGAGEQFNAEVLSLKYINLRLRRNRSLGAKS